MWFQMHEVVKLQEAIHMIFSLTDIRFACNVVQYALEQMKHSFSECVATFAGTS